MRKVIGLGETILDILFRHKQPTAAVPGGSSFNSIISIGRAGIPAIFVGETGNDEVGQQIADFLKENHVDASYLRRLDQIKSSISLAFLDLLCHLTVNPPTGEGFSDKSKSAECHSVL